MSAFFETWTVGFYLKLKFILSFRILSFSLITYQITKEYK